jgi:phage terminase large subunit-like protein
MTTTKRQVQDYIDGIRSGKIVAGRWLKAAIERHLWDLKHAEQRGYYFDEKLADLACYFFPTCLRFTKGEWAGRRFDLSESQLFIVWNLFGWRRKDGTRRFRYAYLTAGRKWGKSEFAAGLALLLTILDYPCEPAAEVYCAATKEEQARIVFNVAKEMARTSEILSSQCSNLAKAILVNADGYQANSFLKPIGSDSKTSDGLNIHGAVLDEIHEWRDRHLGLYDKLTTASGARRQPLIVMITTAGDDRSTVWNNIDSICTQALQDYRSDDPIGDTYFAFIARIDDAWIDANGIEHPADDPFDSACWKKANPNYPITPKHDYLQEQANAARSGPIELNKFKRYCLNVKVTSNEKAIDDTLWSLAAGELSDWNKAEVVCGAWDLGGRDDLAAVSLVARFHDGTDQAGENRYRYEIQSRSFINSENERDIAKEPWADYVRRGLLIVSPSELNDLKATCKQWWREYKTKDWAYDPHTSRDVAQDLTSDGLKCVEFYQNCSMYNEPLRTFLKALKAGAIRHDGNPLLAWCASNLVTTQNAKGEVMPDKRGSKEKIDPMVATIMAFRLASLAPQRAKGSLFVF